MSIMNQIIRRSVYDDDIEERYCINRNTHICKRKVSLLREYYKKRDQWTDTNDLTVEYKSIISLLGYLQDIVFGGTNQEYFDSITKKLLINDKPIIVIDYEYKLDQDIWDCVTYYKDGFTDSSGGENFTTEQIAQQVKITNLMVKINNNPNFIYMFKKSIDAGCYVDMMGDH